MQAVTWPWVVVAAAAGAVVGAAVGVWQGVRFARRTPRIPGIGSPIPVSISARHAHLSQETIDKLFGPGYRLHVRNPLSQPGQFAAQETITLVGPRGRLERVRVLGPPRDEDQIEISRSDEIALGLDAPLRVSGDLTGTPGITLVGPAGQITLDKGVVCAARHIHMNPADAKRFGVHDRQRVRVSLDTDGRDLEFGDVVVRVSPDYRLELHVDTDEGNAAGIRPGDVAVLEGIDTRP